jgi:alpha-mannosidase
MKTKLTFLIIILIDGSLSGYGQGKKIGQAGDTIHVIDHANMDMNWLWTYSETMQMCNDNHMQVVAPMDEFPDFTMLQYLS